MKSKSEFASDANLDISPPESKHSRAGNTSEIRFESINEAMISNDSSKRAMTVCSMILVLAAGIGVSSLYFCNSRFHLTNQAMLDRTHMHESLNGEYYFASFGRTHLSSRFILCYFRVKYVDIQGKLGIRAKFLRGNEVLDVVGSLYERKGTRDFHFNETIAIFRIPYGTDMVLIGVKWQISRGAFYADENSVFLEYRTEMGKKPSENSCEHANSEILRYFHVFQHEM